MPDRVRVVKRDSKQDGVARQERWAVSSNKAEDCKLTNQYRALETAREYRSKVFDIEIKSIKRKWKTVINRKVELMWADGYIPPGDVKHKSAPTKREKELYFNDEYYTMGDPLYRPALYKIVETLPTAEHELLREYARERLLRPQTAQPRFANFKTRSKSSSTRHTSTTRPTTAQTTRSRISSRTGSISDLSLVKRNKSEFSFVKLNKPRIVSAKG